jgi:CubicO group peptidase (beta-lactamase class C family)
VNNQARYSAIWEPAHGPNGASAQWSDHAIKLADYQSVFDARTAEGFRAVRINGYSVAGQTRRHLGEDPGPAWDSRHNFNILNLPQHLRNVRQQGYRVADISCYMSLEPNPELPPPAPPAWVTRFSSIWVASDGRDWDVSLPADGNSYQTIFERQVSQLGRFPVRVSGYTPGDTQKFVAVFERARGMPAEAHHRIDLADYEADQLRLRNAGWRQLAVGGYSLGRGTGAVQRFNPLWERRDADVIAPALAATFMRDFEVPGLSLAVAKDGRLVYAAGFGLADKSTGAPVTPASLLRAASVSKTITAVALMKLAAEGRVALEDPVFGADGHLSELGNPVDPRVGDITVGQLLEHSGGGWPNDDNDPMYTNPQLSSRELISWVLANRSLSAAPGTAYAYSNFGYCVLGRVIEEITGQTYEEYARQSVLLPCGVQGMFIAGDTEPERRPGEVTYYGLDGDDPYGIKVRRMDAPGGWVATPTDLLRFAVRVDRLPAPPDILPAPWITTMTTPSGLPGSDGFAKGWEVGSDGTWSHSGFLAGTASLLVRTADGYCWAALANSGRRNITTAGLNDLMWKIHDRVDVWPPLNQPL